MRREWLELSPDETDDWLRRSAQAFGTRPDEVLIAAVARALAAWADTTTIAMDIEGHGRVELPGEDIDLSRTIGWFTTIYPLVLSVGPPIDLADAIKTVKEAKRRVPEEGIGFLAGRYLAPDAQTRSALANLPPRIASFNYLGRLDRPPASAAFKLSPYETGPNRSVSNARSHALAFEAVVRDERLSLTLSYDSIAMDDREARSLVARAMSELRGMIARCLAADVSTRTPSDYPTARLRQSQLAALLGSLKKATG
jgi:non-ribosomal peptide synthase protein (TIGR01720 family)